MPKSLRLKILGLAQRKGERPLRVINNAAALYERFDLMGQGAVSDTELNNDDRRILRNIMRKLGRIASARMSEEDRKERAKAGGNARSESLTAEQRTEIARKAGQSRWKKKEQPPG